MCVTKSKVTFIKAFAKGRILSGSPVVAKCRLCAPSYAVTSHCETCEVLSNPLKDKIKMNKKLLKLIFDILKYVLAAVAGYFTASCSVINF